MTIEIPDEVWREAVEAGREEDRTSLAVRAMWVPHSHVDTPEFEAACVAANAASARDGRAREALYAVVDDALRAAEKARTVVDDGGNGG